MEGEFHSHTYECGDIFLGFGFLINHSRTMSDTRVHEMKPGRCRIFEHLSADVCKAERVTAGEALKFHPLHSF